MGNEKLRVYRDTEAYPKEGTFIACLVKSMWDFDNKATAMETFEHWGNIHHIGLYFIMYIWNEEYAYWKKVKKIENPKDYPEIVEFCKERNIELL